ncbi:MAG: hypothetical protein ACREN5_16420, partial [Gemmatimonadales bacterium]
TLDPEVLANARAEFNDTVMEYMEKNPDATRGDIRKFVSGEFSDITAQARARMGSAPSAAPAKAPPAPTKVPAAEPAPAGGRNPYDTFDEAQ